MQTATPTASPVSGIYASAITVTLDCTDVGAAIYFTTDGTDPLIPSMALPVVNSYAKNALFGIPTYVEVDYTYYGATNNIQTETFRNSAGNVVAILTYTYASGGAANNDLVTKIQRTA